MTQLPENLVSGAKDQPSPIYHVFLSHRSSDKPAVTELARKLNSEGIEPFLDEWNLVPGEPWQAALEDALKAARTCAVFIGPSGMGPWQHEEMRVAIERRVQQGCGDFRVIPVLLPEAKRGSRSKLPTFLTASTWVVFERSIEEAEPLRRLICGIRGTAPGPGPNQARFVNQCPYRGLQFFDVGDAPFFRGREAVVEWLVAAVHPRQEHEDAPRFLAIIGASGSGKSSLARAGLLAALKRGAFENSSEWPVAICRPGATPPESLAVALGQSLSIQGGPVAIAELAPNFRSRKQLLHLTTALALGARREQRLVLLVDQFEEVFTECTDETDRRAFIENLTYAANVVRGQTVVVLAIRADFYGRCARYDEFAALVSEHQYLVGSMSDVELRRAIEQPAQLVGSEFESGLVDALIEEVREQPRSLPLLQDALRELWLRRDCRNLTFEAYREIGRMSGALAQRADGVLARLSEEDRAICRQIFLRLTKPGEGTEDSRRRVLLGELTSGASKGAVVERIVKKLADAMLLVTDADPPTSESSVEVIHEALIRSWPELRRWIEGDRAGLRLHRSLTEAADQWARQSRDESYLFSGTRLAVIREWAAQHVADLNQTEQEFVIFSQMQQDEHMPKELPRCARFETARTILVRYLSSSSATDRRKAITVLPALVPPEFSEQVREFLLERVSADSAEIVRHRAAELLCRRGDARWFLERVVSKAGTSSEDRFRLALAAAHCCNTPELSPTVLAALPAEGGRNILSIASAHRVWVHLGQLATFFALVYVACLAVDEIVGNGLTTLVSAISVMLWRAPVSVISGIGAFQCAAVAVVTRYLLLKNQIENRSLISKTALLVGLVAVLILRLPSFLAGLPRFIAVALSEPPSILLGLVSFVFWFVTQIPLVAVLTDNFIVPLARPLHRGHLFGRAVLAALVTLLGRGIALLVPYPNQNSFFEYLTPGPLVIGTIGLPFSVMLTALMMVMAILAFRTAGRVVAASTEIPHDLFA